MARQSSTTYVKSPVKVLKKKVIKGKATPRIATEPLRTLNRKTSKGHLAINFSESVLGIQLLPWQKYWLIHALELDENGDFRYRTVLTLVARQSGKTTLLQVLILFFMYMGLGRFVLGSAQSLDIARESWLGAVEIAQNEAELKDEIRSIRYANGEQELRLSNGARYRIAAATRGSGRGLSVDLLCLDELREHRDWIGWAALSKTTFARPNALTVGISNAGDDASVVLNNLRSAALAGKDSTLGIFEWSAEDDAELEDRNAWAQANPGLGHTISEKAILSALNMDPPAVFRTEVLCQRVDSLNAAVDVNAWRSESDTVNSLENYQDKIVMCLDVAPDGAHVSLVGAAEVENGVRVEVFGSWSSTDEARTHFPEIVKQVNPKETAWFPSGPAAALAPELRNLGATELKGTKVNEACQGFSDLVRSRRIQHPGDPLLDAHVAGASKLVSGDGWRFTRRGVGHCDAVYAAAGAVHTLLTLPEEVPHPKAIVLGAD